MLQLHRTLSALRRALDAAQQELSLLEQDLGLCAACGERPPLPLKQRALRSLSPRTAARGGRRVA
jgi:hypothetical protein